MTRIVSGAAGGRQLQVPAKGTRPTSDRVREAMFSSIEALVDLSGARVLDLFAGTGALGLEALSRGASAVTLVESDRAAAVTLRRNVELVGLPGAVVRQQLVESFLHEVATPFDLVLADPPYALSDADLAGVLDAVAGAGDTSSWLGPVAIVVVERSGRAGQPRWPTAIQPIKDRRYGDTVLWYGRAGGRELTAGGQDS